MLPYRKFVLGFGCIILFFFIINNVFSISVVPKEVGFGMETPAGRGGEVYKVTNLNSTGEGSLRDCINKKNSRVCVFEVSGTIFLENNLNINNPYITIAGQTAPSPGITIAGAGLSVKSHDVLIQHIRIRVGDDINGPDYEDRDAILIGSNSNDVYNVVIDHVSASWSIDEIISTWSEYNTINNVNILNSIFSEALYDSYHPDGAHSMGILIGKNSKNILIKDNLLAYNSARNPLIRDDSTNVIIANNFIYGSDTGSKNKIYFGTRGEMNIPLRASVISNVYVSKDDEDFLNIIYIDEESSSDTKIYLSDNLGPVNLTNQWESVLGKDEFEASADFIQVSINNLNLKKSSEVEEEVLINSGSRPLDRDKVDLRILESVSDRTGRIIDSQDEVGGWPELEKNYREFVVPTNPSGDDDKDGYTNLEELLHAYSFAVEVEEDYNFLIIESDNLGDEEINNSINSSKNYISVTQDVSLLTYVYVILGFGLVLFIAAIVIKALRL